MTVLNLAGDIKLGTDQVDAVYLGATQVWSSGGDVEPTPPDDLLALWDWSDAPSVDDLNPLRPSVNLTEGTEWVGSHLQEHGTHRDLHWDRAINGVRVVNIVPTDTPEQLITEEPLVAGLSNVDVHVAMKFDVLPPTSASVLCATDNSTEIGGHYIAAMTWIDASDDDTVKWGVAIYLVGPGELTYLLRTDVAVDTDPHVIGLRMSSPAEFGLLIDDELQTFVDAHCYDDDSIAAVEDVRALLADPVDTVNTVITGGGAGGWGDYWTEAPGPQGYTGWERRVLVRPTTAPAVAVAEWMLAGVVPEVTDVDNVPPFEDAPGSLTDPFVLDDLTWIDTLKASDGVTDVAGAVATWESAEGEVFALVDSGAAPRVGDVTTPSGADAVSFTVAGKSLRKDVSATWTSATGFTIYMVASKADWENGGGYLFTDDLDGPPRITGSNGVAGGVVATDLAGLDRPPPADDAFVAIGYSYNADDGDPRARLVVHDGTTSSTALAPAKSTSIVRPELGISDSAVAFVGIRESDVTEDVEAIVAQMAVEYLTP